MTRPLVFENERRALTRIRTQSPEQELTLLGTG
jgi:hypothetical protein